MWLDRYLDSSGECKFTFIWLLQVVEAILDDDNDMQACPLLIPWGTNISHVVLVACFKGTVQHQLSS